MEAVTEEGTFQKPQGLIAKVIQKMLLGCGGVDGVSAEEAVVQWAIGEGHVILCLALPALLGAGV